MIPKCWKVDLEVQFPQTSGKILYKDTNDLSHLKNPPGNGIEITISHVDHTPTFHDDDGFDTSVDFALLRFVKVYTTMGNGPWALNNVGWAQPKGETTMKAYNVAHELMGRSRDKKIFTDLEKLVDEWTNYCCPGPDHVEQIASKMDH